jgi:hypothetical protein
MCIYYTVSRDMRMKRVISVLVVMLPGYKPIL